MALTGYDYSIQNDFPNQKVAPSRLWVEVNADPTIQKTLAYIDTDGDVCSIYFADALDSGEQTALDAVVAAHSGEPLLTLMPILLESPFTPIDAGVSEVVANGRPAIEVQPDITAFAGARMRWPEVGEMYTKVLILVQFILKATGTGSNIRLAMKAKSNATGSDTSVPFSPVGRIVVPVNFTTIGEVFEGQIEFGRSSFSEGDAVAIQVGRDGNEEIGTPTPVDDVNVPIQIIAFTIGVK